MAALHLSSPLQPSAPWSNNSSQLQQSPSDSAQIVLTRHQHPLNMPDVNLSNETTFKTSETQVGIESQSAGRRTPLIPDQNLNTICGKRKASVTEHDDKETTSIEATPLNTTVDIVDDATHICLCQRDPKIPRPPFILYRQHHHASVVAQHPGLANPEISKIIGEQWQKQTPEIKQKWKSLAEEEKFRHQQQYPDYRYQPKRHGRKGSLSDIPGSATTERAKCSKCAGRSNLGITSPGPNSASYTYAPVPQVSTPLTRTLPMMSNLSLQTLETRPDIGHYTIHNMSPASYDERDDLGLLSPDFKRRRYNGDHPQTLVRTMHPRYVNNAHTGGTVGPGTPFPFDQVPSHPYPQAIAEIRRESLPSFRGMTSPSGLMAPPPPPRPKMGYMQHCVSQGNFPADRKLTLPPLQTTAIDIPLVTAPLTTPGLMRSAEDQIMSILVTYKIKTLAQIAPAMPITKEAPRGPFIAIEGNNTEAVTELAKWLQNEFKKDQGLTIKLIDGPDVTQKGDLDSAMIEYHLLVSLWLAKSKEIVKFITQSPTATPFDSEINETSPKKPYIRERIDENSDDDPASSKNSGHRTSPPADDTDTHTLALKSGPSHSNIKPVVVIPNFSLHASNTFACRIPIPAYDAYAPRDHWQWTATQWRGVIGPDLTIFLRDDSVDGNGIESAGSVGSASKQAVEMEEGGKLIVVNRSFGKGGTVIEAHILRRLGFEVSEWIRAFGN
ncbi:Hypothetical protein R9X50_00690200 [Acrodontium crateriforme]|uniref:HMG box domain-containing protein n=1 Tax=Acrodontium crateriforme TaxID=150365 RepID=A0AAQ3RDV2_9PEZI|nr:Hypothetical protein R9X50_00690200 [Acrodontium crateriforme]